MSERPGKTESKAPASRFNCRDLTCASKNLIFATEPTPVSACVSVARRCDNQMAIEKKTCEMLLPPLRTDRDHASTHLLGPAYASTM